MTEYVTAEEMRRADSCCEGLRGWGLAWHRYAVHGGPLPRRSRIYREGRAAEFEKEVKLCFQT